VSGQLAVGDDGSIVGKGNFAEQFHRVFANLEYVLAGIGAGFRDVAKFTTYLVDPANIDEFMSLRAALFPTRFGDGLYPPNTLLIVQRLVKAEFLIEVEAIVRAPE
jgi:enamine deaminase RidA (YjgF/YER057c/UK114 family)